MQTQKQEIEIFSETVKFFAALDPKGAPNFSNPKELERWFECLRSRTNLKAAFLFAMSRGRKRFPALEKLKLIAARMDHMSMVFSNLGYFFDDVDLVEMARRYGVVDHRGIPRLDDEKMMVFYGEPRQRLKLAQ